MRARLSTDLFSPQGILHRTNQLLAGLLVVQLIVAGVVLWPRTAQSSPAQPALPELTVAQVNRLTITDAQGASITLSQQTGQWVLPEADDYPLQTDKVTGLVDKLAAIKLDRPVTRTEASHKQLKLAADDYERLITVVLQDGSSHTLYLGSSPAYGSTHFRLDGQADAYLTSALTVWDVTTQPSSWLDTLYSSVAVAEVSALTLNNPQGTLPLTRVDESTWALGEGPQGIELDQVKAAGLVQRAATVRMDKPLGRTPQPAWGMDAPQASITLTTADTTVTLEVGALVDGEAGYVLKSSASPYYVRIPRYLGDALVAQTADDLLVVATPVATP